MCIYICQISCSSVFCVLVQISCCSVFCVLVHPVYTLWAVLCRVYIHIYTYIYRSHVFIYKSCLSCIYIHIYHKTVSVTLPILYTHCERYYAEYIYIYIHTYIIWLFIERVMAHIWMSHARCAAYPVYTLSALLCRVYIHIYTYIYRWYVLLCVSCLSCIYIYIQDTYDSIYIIYIYIYSA